MRAREQRGFALLWALILVIVIGALSAVVLERDVQVRRDGVQDLEALRTFHAERGESARAATSQQRESGISPSRDDP